MSRCLFLVLLMLPLAGLADQSEAPWLHPDVLEAAAGMQLTDEQLPRFRDAITNLVHNQTAATNKLLRQNNIADLDRKLKTVTNRQFRKMDREVGEFLSEAQLTGYRTYRQALKTQLTRYTVTRGGSSSASLSDTEKTLGQTSAHHH